MSELKVVVDELLAAAVAWYRETDKGPALVERENDIYRAVAAYLAKLESMSPPGPRTDQARQLTWGTVPAGWWVQAPNGEWYRVVQTRMRDAGIGQEVTLDMGGQRFTHPRNPEGPVTACPGPATPTDAAIEALGFPRVLEDGT